MKCPKKNGYFRWPFLLLAGVARLLSYTPSLSLNPQVEAGNARAHDVATSLPCILSVGF